MTDIDLLVFGCAVMFLAYGGAYVYIRERFLAQEQRQEARRPAPVPAREAIAVRTARLPR